MTDTGKHFYTGLKLFNIEGDLELYEKKITGACVCIVPYPNIPRVEKQKQNIAF